MTHPHLPGPRPLAVPGIGFPQNISISSDVVDRAAFGDLLDIHRGASKPPIDRIVWLPLVCGPIVRLLAARAWFRTIQICPKDSPAMPRQSEGAAPATFVGGLTMSERVVDEGQSWASDIIGVLSGVGLYSVLIFLVTFLCLYVPA